MKEKVCLTTFVYGSKYQDYLPLLLYSCQKAYPEYDVVLFLYDKLRDDIGLQINSLDLKIKITIHENSFNDCPQMSPLKSKCLRWVLWDDSFNQYDYLYIIDIDMFYISESLPLHTQHIQHMQTTNLPFDNMRRIYKKGASKRISIMRRIKYAGLYNIIKFLRSYNKTEYKLTGLQFIDIKKYYSIYNSHIRDSYKRDIYKNKYLSYVMSPENEILLYQINKRLGFDVDRLAIQTDSSQSLDFNNTTRAEFRPHHGIHLGIFREDPINFSESTKRILDSDTYKYYFNEFKNIYTDKVFQQLYNSLSENVKIYIDRIFQYYEYQRGK